MDFLLERLAANKVTQTILTNKYEQTPNYDYVSTRDCNSYFEDLFKNRNKSVSSLSLASNGSAHSLVAQALTETPPESDSFFHIVNCIQNPSITLYPKDQIPRLVKEFRTTLLNDESSFGVKKLTKNNKQEIMRLLSSTEPTVGFVNDVVLTYFSHYLKTNLIVSTPRGIFRSVVCCDDTFDTSLMTEVKPNGFKSTFGPAPYQRVKEYMFENRILDTQFVESLSVQDLRMLAKSMGVDLCKDENGKQVRLLKDELRKHIIKKI